MNNELHYDAHNALACCKLCNSMKGKMTMHQFLDRIQKIVAATSMVVNGE